MKLKGTLTDENVLIITPLIDIMFLILIFFVLNSSFEKNKAVEVNVPQAISGSSIGEIETKVVITEDQRIFINDKETTLSSFSASLLNSVGSLKEPTIIIEGDKHISYEFLMGIMDRVKVLGFNNISLVVKRL
ncbi:MAG: biopolymer transporter ExbD [Spirochaetales bacterium]|nr:biopolymer transporter ExbD [Spirochaetales bacterium]